MSDPPMPPTVPDSDVTSSGLPNSSGNWWSRLPRWAQWTIGVVAAVILLGIGGAIGSSGGKESELKDEVASLEQTVASAEAAQKSAEAKAVRAEGTEAAEAKIGEEQAA